MFRSPTRLHWNLNLKIRFEQNYIHADFLSGNLVWAHETDHVSSPITLYGLFQTGNPKRSTWKHKASSSVEGPEAIKSCRFMWVDFLKGSLDGSANLGVPDCLNPNAGSLVEL